MDIDSILELLGLDEDIDIDIDIPDDVCIPDDSIGLDIDDIDNIDDIDDVSNYNEPSQGDSSNISFHGRCWDKCTSNSGRVAVRIAVCGS